MKPPFDAFDLPEPPPVPKLNSTRELTGWEEFNRWACANDPAWNEVRRALEIGYIASELDALKYLAAAMLSQSCRHRKLALDAARSVPPRILVIDPNANP